MIHPDPYLPAHGDTRYRVEHYELELTYAVVTNRLDERARLHVRIVEPTTRIDVDLRGLQLGGASVDGKPVKYRRKAGGWGILVGDRQPGDRFVLELRVSGKPRPVPGTHGEAGWEELTEGAMVGSQPQGAPSWFPCNNDAADKATYRIDVLTDVDYQVIANGTRTRSMQEGRRRRWVYEMDQPMSPYLATVQIGRYVETECWSYVPVSIVHPPAVRVGEGTAFEHQGRMVDHFSELFGPYPFTEYRAVVVDDELEIPLEAQGLSTFGRNFTEPTWENERLVAHELAHQWFGNAVTGQLLQDIWLHEGFACYAEWLWSDHRRAWCESPSVQERAAHHHAQLEELDEGVTLAEPGMKTMFDDWVYKRGALTLHALRAVVGDETFFGLLRSWVETHRGGTASTAQFEAHCVEGAGELGERVGETLHAWLHEPELPPLPELP
ncbi:Peptidase family M1 [Kytococcus aerolatus]|uniref:Aminopeptidase N n=1 Tax=Kytococcus aerolatus TaxID=592308 RepID=A0A212T2E7_9MICO|nr:M1 family metallopeptidase [Kytococcus aerolatus]SNC60223.1 Peptidase family M1 [Kytococcus aerolatus]